MSSSANPCDSGAHHHTDPKSDEEQDENTTPPSQKPPRPGIKSVRKKRKRTERARRKEQREKLEEKNRKKAVDISLYQFIKEEVFHIRKNRQMKKRRPNKVERGPVFKPVRRPTPPPPKNAFCMRPKNKKKSHLLKYETSVSAFCIECTQFLTTLHRFPCFVASLYCRLRFNQIGDANIWVFFV